MFVVERFLSDRIRTHGKYPVSTNGEDTWYQMTCKISRLKHHVHFLTKDLRKVLWRTLYDTSRTEPAALMIIFHVEKRIIT